jgi:hypothetical protein
MTIATLLIGLPGSGKTTWAQEQAMRVIDLENRALSSYALKSSQPIIVDGALWVQDNVLTVIKHLQKVGYRNFQFVYWTRDVNSCLHNDKLRGRSRSAAYTIVNHSLAVPSLNWYSEKYPGCFFAIEQKEVWQPIEGYTKAIHDDKGDFVSLNSDLALCNLLGKTVIHSNEWWKTDYRSRGWGDNDGWTSSTDEEPVSYYCFMECFKKLNIELNQSLWDNLIEANVVRQVTKVIDDWYADGYEHHWELHVPELYQYLSSNSLI